jgi:hypothetical protein
VESTVEDIFYGRAINRIRSYYHQLAGPEARYFMLLPYDDVPAVLRNMGLTPSRWQLYFTSASAIAVVNSVVGGAALAIACWVAFDASLGTAAVVGGVFAIVSVTAHVNWTRRRLERGVPADVLFPSPTG